MKGLWFVEHKDPFPKIARLAKSAPDLEAVRRFLSSNGNCFFAIKKCSIVGALVMSDGLHTGWAALDKYHEALEHTDEDIVIAPCPSLLAWPEERALLERTTLMARLFAKRGFPDPRDIFRETFTLENLAIWSASFRGGHCFVEATSADEESFWSLAHVGIRLATRQPRYLIFRERVCGKHLFFTSDLGLDFWLDTSELSLEVTARMLGGA